MIKNLYKNVNYFFRIVQNRLLSRVTSLESGLQKKEETDDKEKLERRTTINLGSNSSLTIINYKFIINYSY